MNRLTAATAPDHLKHYLGGVDSNTNDDTDKKHKKRKKQGVAQYKETKKSTLVDIDDQQSVQDYDTIEENKRKIKKEKIDEYQPTIANIDDFKHDDQIEKIVKQDWVTIQEEEEVKKKNVDLSPPRGRSRTDREDLSPPRGRTRIRGDQDDLSPPRGRSNDLSPPRGRTRNQSEQEDLSPPRTRSRGVQEDLSPPRGRSNDLSPPRTRRRGDQEDLSPPRNRDEHTPPAQPIRKSRFDIEPTFSTTIKQEPTTTSTTTNMEANQKLKMSFGADAGLHTGSSIKEQALKRVNEQKELFEKADKKLLGKDAETVYRDKRGKKLDSLNEYMNKDSKKPSEESQMEWGVGKVQQEEKERQRQRLEEERLAPFSRTADDKTLNEIQKDLDRWGDPMAAFDKPKKKKKKDKDKKKKKKKKKNSSDDDSSSDSDKESEKVKKLPIYQGSFPTNRFNIRPGYRWDGVDRSNGFEKEYFMNQNRSNARKYEAYKWSTEDM